ncbi:GerMN domain-containing protein [Dolichospermum circinale CS-534/05]|uniref:GerMN domain-containing protein n=1 Tax=Dolichospermum circinale TaxID=109265 RepID=UPI00232E4183|nr:GerMN domain-containing protein [Dolichospermum circinale]MDB9455667.1 GerMN domain-containing protein [Dolichospermum circinale CS-541/06]MDB9461568.1 GerMN domain-containing protein [Dolichospermum circinale CS-541/04]MDB9489885.1 GerMN domain-containing protein [Dolichospermum circinale CS-534/05]MDB9547727.1 GerMN domain-containing protein [Dolichospermum circinale CS-1031]
MNDQQRTNSISSGLVAAISVAVVAVSGGVAWFSSQSANTPTPTNPSEIIKQPIEQSNSQQGNEQTASIYWLRSKENRFDLVPQPLKIAATQPNQVLETAFKTLLAGPPQGTDSTTIPQGTQLLGLKAENNDVHVNLSENFTTGGGSSSMIGRIGQVVYTATSLNPQAKVYIEVNGKPLEVLGGEGVELEQPLTRESFQKNYPL